MEANFYISTPESIFPFTGLQSPAPLLLLSRYITEIKVKYRYFLPTLKLAALEIFLIKVPGKTKNKIILWKKKTNLPPQNNFGYTVPVQAQQHSIQILKSGTR